VSARIPAGEDPRMPTKLLVAVAWDDAHSTIQSAYAEHELPHAPVAILTLGWLLKEDEAGVSLANEFCSDGTWRGVTFIPRGMLRKMTHVATPRRTRARVGTQSAAPETAA
jgi:hypothetical protein